MEDRRKTRFFKLATDAYRQSDDKLWVSALACAGVVGNYQRGATLGLASDMCVSVDTVEDLAHAYSIYHDLCELEGGEFRKYVRNARRAPYIQYSHFRALWDARSHHKLTDNQVLEILKDVVQAEGNISSRDIDIHVRSRYGDNRGWEFFGQRAAKELFQTLQQPDLPNVPEEMGNTYKISCKVAGKKHTVNVIANNPQRAINIAKKEFTKTVDEKALKGIEFDVVPLGQTISDSKHILTTANAWLSDEA